MESEKIIAFYFRSTSEVKQVLCAMSYLDSVEDNELETKDGITSC